MLQWFSGLIPKLHFSGASPSSLYDLHLFLENKNLLAPIVPDKSASPQFVYKRDRAKMQMKERD